MSEDDLRKEEIRGLFTLGIIAIAVTLRYSSGLPATIQAGVLSNVPIHSILDGVILTWGLYAFFMVFAFSGDILPKSFCDMFEGLAKYCLLLSIGFLTITAALLGIANANVMVWIAAGALVIVLVGLVGKGVAKYQNKIRIKKEPVSSTTSPSPPACIQLLEEFREKARKKI